MNAQATMLGGVALFSFLLAVYLLLGVMKAAFRALGRVASQSIGQDGSEGTGEFLRKSLNHPTPLWFSLQIASAFCLIGLAALPAAYFARMEDRGVWFALGCGVLLPVAALLVFDLVIPALIVRGREESVVRIMLRPMKIVHFGLYPISYLLALLGDPEGFSDEAEELEDEPADEGEIQAFIEMGEREGILEEREKVLIRGVVDFGDAILDEVMTPRTDVVAVEVGTPLDDVRRLIAEEMHTRLPVYQENLDRIQGIVHLKDLIRVLDQEQGASPVETILRPVYYAPETMKVHDLLRVFQEKRISMAVVVDEYGGTEGIVTMEDLIEEIVGEIQDEHEEDEEWIQEEATGGWTIDGRTELDDLSTLLGVDLETEEVETAGGLVFSRLGYLPKAGERLSWKSLVFEVLQADEKRIYKLRILRDEQGGEDDRGSQPA